MGRLLRTLSLPRATARWRLTLLYSCMFLLLGTIIVVILFAFTSSVATVTVSVARPLGGAGRGQPGALVVPQIVHQQRSADLSHLLTASWFVLLITALASSVIGWFLAGRVLRPLQQMAASARNISAHNLTERLALRGPDDEFKRLGDTLDDLLARLEASFEAQRRFVANASHELRTPLTVDRTLLQVALADPNASSAQLRAICEELLASGREQERLLEALLALATSESGVEQLEPVDLAVLAGRVIGALGAEEVTASLLAAPTSGDAALIERLIANLIDNAIQHNDERGVVEVTSGVGSEGAYLSVLNTGPAIARSELERLFEPFQRLGGRRTARDDRHHGLGLSIVRAIAIAHGARIDARPRAGGGLSITVTFPRSDAESGA